MAAVHKHFWPNVTIIDTPVGLFERGGRKVKVGRKGTADFHCCFYGNFIAVEVKVGKDRQREKQAAYQAAVERSNGTYIITKTVEDLIKRLEDAEHEHKENRRRTD